MGSRIILACDAYHAMTSDRPYRQAMSHGDALRELRKSAGTQFDPQVVEALLGCLYGDRTLTAGTPSAAE
jgi:HD-GYP domain-containing protein (c-di-GMP phosphodiesterase class II)